MGDPRLPVGMRPFVVAVVLALGACSSSSTADPTTDADPAPVTETTEVVIVGTGAGPEATGEVGVGPIGTDPTGDDETGDDETGGDANADADAEAGTVGDSTEPAAAAPSTSRPSATTSPSPSPSNTPVPAPPTASCTGTEPSWAVQSELVDVDIDGDGNDDVVRTYTSDRDETAIGVRWSGGGWAGFDVGASPDDGDSELLGGVDLDGDGDVEIVLANPGPFPDLLVQVLDGDGCSVELVRDSRTDRAFEAIAYARFDSFAGVRCRPGDGVTLTFGSIASNDPDETTYDLTEIPARLVDGILAFDDSRISARVVEDLSDYAPTVACTTAAGG